MSGEEFLKSINGLEGEAREAKIKAAIEAGYIPEFIKQLKEVHTKVKGVDGTEHDVSFKTTPDCLSIGTDEKDNEGNPKFVRIPMTPKTAQYLANKFGMMLPNARMVNAMFLDPQFKKVVMPHQGDPEFIKEGGDESGMNSSRMTSSEYYKIHNKVTNKKLKNIPLGTPVIGHKKIIVISEKLEKPENKLQLAFHGGLMPGAVTEDAVEKGTIFYQNNTVGSHRWIENKKKTDETGEDTGYVDYSHGVILCSTNWKVDGVEMDVTEVQKKFPELFGKTQIFNQYGGKRIYVPSEKDLAQPSPKKTTEKSINEEKITKQENKSEEIKEKTPALGKKIDDNTEKSAATKEKTQFANTANFIDKSNASAEILKTSSVKTKSEDIYQERKNTVSTKSSGIPKKNADLSHTDKAKETAPQKEEYSYKKSFIIGDSLSNGYKKFVPNGEQINPLDGQSGGKTTREMKGRLGRLIQTRPEDCKGTTLILNGGTNDISSNVSLEEIKDNIATMCRMAQDAGMEVKLLTVLPMFKRNDTSYSQSPAMRQKWSDLNEWIRRGASNVENGKPMVKPENIVDVASTMEDPEYRGSLRKDLPTLDGIHLDMEKGYREMGEHIKEKLSKNESQSEEESPPSSMSSSEKNRTGNFEKADPSKFEAKAYPYLFIKGKPYMEVINTHGFVETENSYITRFEIPELDVYVHIDIPKKLNPNQKNELVQFLVADGNSFDKTLGGKGTPDDSLFRNQMLGAQFKMGREAGMENLTYAIVRPRHPDEWHQKEKGTDAMSMLQKKIESTFQEVHPTHRFDTITRAGHSGGGRWTNADTRKGGLELDPRINKIAGYDMYIGATIPQYIDWVLNKPEALFYHVAGNRVNQETNRSAMAAMDAALQKRGLPLGERKQKNGLLIYTALKDKAHPGGRFKLVCMREGKSDPKDMWDYLHTETVALGFRAGLAFGNNELEEKENLQLYSSTSESYGEKEASGWSKLEAYTEKAVRPLEGGTALT